MAVRLYSEFKSDRGNLYRIEIHDANWLSVATTFNVDGSGFQLTYEGQTDDIVSPIVGSKLSFGGYSTNATFETFVNTLKSFQENRFRVVVYTTTNFWNSWADFWQNASNPWNQLDLFWVGWIVQDLVTIEDESQPYVYQFTATDGIGRLANIDYNFNNDDPAGLTRVTGILDNCLSLIGTDDLWPAGETYVRTSVDWWETSSQTYATNKDTLYEHGIDVRVFTNEDDDGNTIYSSALDVLQQLAITYGARVYQTNGHWVFEQYVNRAAATRYVTNYDKTMTAIATIAVNDDVTIDQTSGYARLNGGQFNYLPAVGSVSVEYVQEKFSSTSKPITFRSTAPTKTLGIIGASTSTQLKFYGPHNYNITSSTGATTNDGTIAVVWRIQIRIESATTPGLFYYYNRAFNGFAASAVYGNASWSTTAGYYYYHAPFGRVIFGALSLNTAPVIITANLPTSGTLRITSEHFGNYDPANGTAYTLEPHQNDTWSTTLTIARMDNAKDNSSSIIYRVNNANPNVDSNIELNLGTTRIANGLFQTGDLSVYNGTSWVSGIAFRRGSTGTGDQILNLLISEMLGLHAAPIQRFNGEMFNDAMIENRLAFDGARYLNLGGTFTARNGHFSADWFLIDYDPVSVGTLGAERLPVAQLTSGGSNVGNYDGVIEVGRVGGMAVDATQEKIGPFEQTASGGKIDGTLGVTGASTLQSLNAGSTILDDLTAGVGIVLTNWGDETTTWASWGDKWSAGVRLGKSTIEGASVVGDISVSNELNVSGASTLSSASVTGNQTIGGTLGVTGTSTIGTLNAGASTLSSAAVTGNTSVGGTLGVTGTSNLSNTNIDGAANLNATASVNGAWYADIDDVTATASGTYEVKNTDYILFTTWSGGNGTFTIVLPPVESSDGRMIRIKTDSTISNSTALSIVPDAGDTSVRIDGESSSSMTRSYDGATYLCHNGDWWVIQKKDKG